MKVYLRTFGCRANQYDTEAVRAMVEAGGHAIVVARRGRGRRGLQQLRGDRGRRGRPAAARCAARRATQPALRSVVMGCAAGARRHARAQLRIASLPTVEHVVAGADLDGDRRGARPRAAPRRCRAARADGHARAAAHPGRLRRALHLLRDDARARRESQPRRSTSSSREATRARRAASGDRASPGFTSARYGARHRHVARRAGRAARARRARACASASRRSRRRRSTSAWPRCSPARRTASRRISTRRCSRDRIACCKRMGRHWYTRATLRRGDRAPRRAARRSSDSAPTSSPAFPARRDADHARDGRARRALPFTYLHVFPYSARPGTAAERLPRPRARRRVARARAARAARRSAARKAARIPRVARRRARRTSSSSAAAATREGLTEDYLAVRLARSPRSPRGARFAGARSIARATQRWSPRHGPARG